MHYVSTCNDKNDLNHDDENDETKNINEANCDKKPNRHIKIFFKNSQQQILSVYKCILLNKKKELLLNDNLVDIFNNRIINPQKWMIVMLSGGHFAAAIFDHNNIVCHKTFHSYTVRSKQGNIQSIRDNKSGHHHKSAGASLRRYNEQSLAQHVRKIIIDWADIIKKCNLIFFRAVGPSNRSVLFGGKNPPILKSDDRLRNIPIPTKRPTFNETKRVYDLLSTIEIYASDDEFKNRISKLFSKKINDSPKPTKKPRLFHSKIMAGNQMEKSKKIDNIINEPESAETTDGSLELNDEIDLSWSDCQISFDHLREYEDTVPQNKKKNSKQSKSSSKEKNQKTSTLNKNLNKIETLEEKYENIKKKLINYCNEKNKKCFITTLKDLNRLCEKNSEKNNSSQKSDENVSRQEFLKLLNTSVIKKSDDTLLHLAAQRCLPELVVALLEIGVDPNVKNASFKAPFDVAGDELTKNSFKGFIGPVNSESNEVEDTTSNEIQIDADSNKTSHAKEQEQLKKVLPEKCSLSTSIELTKDPSSSSSSSSLKKCNECGLDLSKMIPFEYSSYKFCSISCLKNHRAKTGNYGLKL
ncbi:conserved hypothetical protein [Pediculus humanus corporis]|uniref:VLRF1 domain-containing protein n=1 Tax=Pediculus humanus subsp. corporis TaxID=121224 RepID=E0VK53_PEDHC|nr:uncharacterized protein Phum_PHUM256970 [Pediculus humanus corporis]EEB13759.1 conserved hypothetical protein [Pediculus humanus corporis]